MKDNLDDMLMFLALFALIFAGKWAGFNGQAEQLYAATGGAILMWLKGQKKP